MATFGTWRRQGSTIALLDVYGSSNGSTTAELELELEGAPLAPIGPSRPTLRNGSRGSAVRDLQGRLTALGFVPGPVDGIFGGQTDTAVRAFQRSRQIAADGIVGARTWGELDRAGAGGRKPTPRPYPSPAPGPAPTGVGARIVAEARKHLGFQEGPNNENPFSAYFGVPNVAWCAYFVSYVHTMAGVPLNIGGCDALLDRLVDNNTFTTKSASPGDIVVFDWKTSDHDPAEHVGIVESVTTSGGSTRVNTIEGNSSNGVNRRSYPFGSTEEIVGYGRVR